MDLQTRKIEFIQEFLKIQSEEVISQFEWLLMQKAKRKGKKFVHITPKELELRINKSEAEFAGNRCKLSAEILSKYQK